MIKKPQNNREESPFASVTLARADGPSKSALDTKFFPPCSSKERWKNPEIFLMNNFLYLFGLNSVLFWTKSS